MFSGWEWVIIGVVALVIIMWGPSKIPEFARAIGKAKGEFEKASREIDQAAKEVVTATPATTVRRNEDILIETAQKLGVTTEGKTRDQIATEVSQRLKTVSA